MNIVVSSKKLSIRTHIHLEQATSVEDNAVKIKVPLIIQDTATAVNKDNYSGDGTSEQEYKSTKLSIRQYNSFQQLGSAGLPYIDTVTKKEVTK